MRAEFLSGFRLTGADGSDVCISVRKAMALFAYLALASDRPHSREKLASLLWYSAGDRAARQSLRRCLTDLRRALGAWADRVLVIESDRIGFVPGAVEVDVLAFRQHVENRDFAKCGFTASKWRFTRGSRILTRSRSKNGCLPNARHTERPPLRRS